MFNDFLLEVNEIREQNC